MELSGFKGNEKVSFLKEIWRREGDSNPRGAFTPTRFPGVRLKPLGHPSNLTVRISRNIAALLCICNHIAGRPQRTQLQSKLNSDMILR